MRFSIVGISHWKSEVSIREQFYLDGKRKRSLSEHLENIAGGALVLDTCNRTELYGFCDPEQLIHALCRSTQTDHDYFKEHGYIKTGDAALNHLYRVAVGLDSQVLGDVQIIQQVKIAYKAAKKRGLNGDFHQLVQSVFRTHKRSRSETDFARGSASVGFAATQRALEHFSTLKNIHILLVGAGKMGKVSCKNLISNGAQHISVVNRSINKAKELANSFDIKAHALSELDEEIHQADLIITATGAVKPLIRPEHFENTDSPNNKLIIDLSVPRNVDEEVGSIKGITLIDMDSIIQETEEALKKRKAVIPEIEQIIAEEKGEFLHNKERTEFMLPQIEHITSRLDNITNDELDRVRYTVDEQAFSTLEEVTDRIKKKVLAAHIIRMEKEFEKTHHDA
ncbi:MAG: glutamyl-tRNA reductase [Balneolaceae bacterium]|nr:glutamyl-tRNA reductase [Balneolaceae bacterium]